MGYGDIVTGVHGDYCYFLETPANRKQICMPRSFVKTWIGSIAYPIWISLPRVEADEFPYPEAMEDKFYQLGPNIRILIASYVISNAEKMISLIRQTYESNVAMQIFFPEVIPLFTSVKWTNQSACIARDEQFTESTFEAAGIGGASTSRHYDLIIEDDLIYAKKDDFSDKELQPNQDDIDKAIGWHKIATSLLVPGKHTRIHNTGTRWADQDLVQYIWDNEPAYKRFARACVNLTQLMEGTPWEECDPTWPEMYDHEQLKMIEAAQGPYMFSTQYLLQPSSPKERLFKEEWLQFYTADTEIPYGSRIFTTVDLAQWTESRRKSDCMAAVLTCAIDPQNHIWIKHYRYARMNPSEVIFEMAFHWNTFHPEGIYIEEVLYQKAIRHFAMKMMNDNEIPRMTLRGVVPENNISKELRIRAIEPYGATLAIHCKPVHTDFIKEWNHYIPNSRLCKKDLLDTLAYQIQVARPGLPEIKPRDLPIGEFEIGVDMDAVLEELLKPAVKSPFGQEQVLTMEQSHTQLIPSPEFGEVVSIFGNPFANHNHASSNSGFRKVNKAGE